jgi:hypothetical protein
MRPRIAPFFFLRQGVLSGSMRGFFVLALLLFVLPARADDGPAYGPMLEGYD